LIKIQLDNANGKIIGNIEEDVRKRISKACSFRPDGFQFSHLYKSRRWDGWIRLFSRNKFRIGLLPRVIKNIWPLKYELEDKTIYSKKSYDWAYAGPHRLIDFQKECIEACVGKMRGLISLPTGAGKTLIMANVMACLGRPTAFICDELVLIDQARDAIAELLGQHIGEISGRDFDIQPITVCSAQSLCGALGVKFNDREVRGDIAKKEEILDFISKIEVVIVDECHIVPANTIFELLSYFIRTDHVYGATATPYRLDGRDLMIEAAVGPTIYEVDYPAVFESGLILKPIFKFIDVPQVDLPKEQWASIHKNMRGWQQLFKAQVIDNETRSQMIANLAVDEVDNGNIVLICVNQIEYGRDLTNRIKAYGVRAKFACSKTPDRVEIIHDYRDGHIPVLISTLVRKGLDVQKASVLILTHGGKDSIQQIGRVLRRDPDNLGKQAVIYDIRDETKYFKAHTKKRIKRYIEFHLLDSEAKQ